MGQVRVSQFASNAIAASLVAALKKSLAKPICKVPVGVPSWVLDDGLAQSYYQGKIGQAIPGTSTRNVRFQLPFMASPECFWKPAGPVRVNKQDGSTSFEQLGQLHSTLHTSMWKSPGSPLHVIGICTKAAPSLLILL